MHKVYHPFTLGLFAALSGCVVEADHRSAERFTDEQEAWLSASLGASFSLIDMTTYIQTGDMPANWYRASVSDAPITVTWKSSTTECKAAEIGSFGSVNKGSFTQIWSIHGEFLGFSWSVQHDLTGLEHHWHNFVTCDGTSIVVGCKSPRTVDYMVSVSGHCLEADSKCAALGTISLPAIRDPDQVETHCPTNCPAALRSCISSCQAVCRGGESNCSRCCECDCKGAIHENSPACPAPPASCYAAGNDYPACL